MTQDPLDPLDRLEAAAEKVARRAEWETANRVGLLYVHAFVGITAGLQMFLFGSAANIEDLAGIWIRAALGVLGIAGGLILWRGIRATPRSIPAEATGLALLGIWDLAMTLGLAWARIDSGDFSPRGLFEPLPPPGTYALPYPVAVYGGLFALICVHLWTLRRLRKDR
jgi:hypothetical protein